VAWAMVVTPGWGRGQFPGVRKTVKGWAGKAASLPFALRGDRDSLPELADVTVQEIKQFTAAERARELMEQRRLAYVAVTRAAFPLVCTGHWWGQETQRSRGPSEALEATREACETRLGQVAASCERPEDARTD